MGPQSIRKENRICSNKNDNPESTALGPRFGYGARGSSLGPSGPVGSSYPFGSPKATSVSHTFYKERSACQNAAKQAMTSFKSPSDETISTSGWRSLVMCRAPGLTGELQPSLQLLHTGWQQVLRKAHDPQGLSAKLNSPTVHRCAQTEPNESLPYCSFR